MDENITFVTIGSQQWTDTNLNVSKFRNGDDIPQATTKEEWEAACANEQPICCSYEYSSTNGNQFGMLYNWHAVADARGLAPEGCHIPTDDEWTVLSDALGGEPVAGAAVKSVSGWADVDPETNGNGTNSSGFNALPGGYRGHESSFYGMNTLAVYWSCTEYLTYSVRTRVLSHDNDYLYRDGGMNKHYGFAVRCVKD